MKNIASALVKAQRAFGPALKTSTNPAYKSRYADLAACVEAVIEGLNANGIYLAQICHESENGVTVETRLIHESGEEFSAGKLHVPAAKQDPQGYGSALTYARRYSLMAACGIAPEDDDGNAGSRPQSTSVGASASDLNEASFRNTHPEIQDLLRKMVPRIIVQATHKNAEGVRAIFEEAYSNFPDEDPTELKKALWYLLDSKTRSAISLLEKK